MISRSELAEHPGEFRASHFYLFKITIYVVIPPDPLNASVPRNNHTIHRTQAPSSSTLKSELHVGLGSPMDWYEASGFGHSPPIVVLRGSRQGCPTQSSKDAPRISEVGSGGSPGCFNFEVLLLLRLLSASSRVHSILLVTSRFGECLLDILAQDF
jgi:hypothetical protein